MDTTSLQEALAKLAALSTTERDLPFRKTVLEYYRNFGRSFPWRDTHDPYRILVSEVMLQQTQTERVVPKYEAFLERFPTVSDLATARQAEVLKLWAGLGYYRRARNLHLAAQTVHTELSGRFPRSSRELKALPGVGPYTAAAVAAFSFCEVVSMIETNIRTVYLLTYFKGVDVVHDREIAPIIDRTIYRKDPRTWFYALMDLGAALKRHAPNVNKQSAHYTRQTPYKGSIRQVRAAVLRSLAESSSALARTTLANALHDRGVKCSREMVTEALKQLRSEGFVVCETGRYRVA